MSNERPESYPFPYGLPDHPEVDPSDSEHASQKTLEALVRGISEKLTEAPPDDDIESPYRSAKFHLPDGEGSMITLFTDGSASNNVATAMISKRAPDVPADCRLVTRYIISSVPDGLEISKSFWIKRERKGLRLDAPDEARNRLLRGLETEITRREQVAPMEREFGLKLVYEREAREVGDLISTAQYHFS